MWGDVVRALALLLVIEGLLPFLSPSAMKRSLGQILMLPDRTVRVLGLSSMIAGVILLSLLN